VDSPDTAMEAPDIESSTAEAIAEEEAAAVVRVAEIESKRDVTLARIAAGVAEDEMESRVAMLEGELRGMREALDRLVPPAPEAEAVPEPVVVETPATEPEIPQRPERHEPRAAQRPKGFFG
jgi:hypothetical protein